MFSSYWFSIHNFKELFVVSFSILTFTQFHEIMPAVIHILLYYYLFYLFVAVLGLCCSTQAFSSCDGLSSCSSIVVVLGLSRPWACGIFPDQGSNLYPPALAGGFFNTRTTREAPCHTYSLSLFFSFIFKTPLLMCL